MKVLSIVGARPQFIKCALVSRRLREVGQEILLHTGQHYDERMSAVFFEELGIPEPEYNLGVGSGSHGKQTGEMLVGIEEVLLKEQPDVVLVYGDTNSTLAAALAAAKLKLPVAHVEAGLRSFNRAMPEEINRVATDRISDVLCCPSERAVQNLSAEGMVEGVHNTGDVMYDALLANVKIAEQKSTALSELALEPCVYVLATVHRPRNTDTPERLSDILSAFEALDAPVLFPVHPRTRKKIAELSVRLTNTKMVEPVSYLDMLMLLKHARKLLTDSGGMQKEAYFLEVPCVTMREETEWTETVEEGWNRLVGADRARIIEAASEGFVPQTRGNAYGEGRAHRKVVEVVCDFAEGCW
ncbi:MAG: UDP-N-acetylglucosamine 2-epimerase (non-hydrolyzing) [Candidatus Latescibacteria bacterium]|nr:UDP-N-acetylglucosamine 2-epimerase (non-hydrolyzing) [Candidatus Latescibacterota bacterium]